MPQAKKMGKRPAFDPEAIDAGSLPLFCDYLCKHARFPPNDAIGACRKEIAVYCDLFRRFNNKNARCLARQA
jgi:hypothetical protein